MTDRQSGQHGADQRRLEQEQALADLDQSIADREQALAEGDQDDIERSQARLDERRADVDPSDLAGALGHAASSGPGRRNAGVLSSDLGRPIPKPCARSTP